MPDNRSSDFQMPSNIRRSAQFPLNSMIDTRIGPVNSGNDLVGAALNGYLLTF